MQLIEKHGGFLELNGSAQKILEQMARRVPEIERYILEDTRGTDTAFRATQGGKAMSIERISGVRSGSHRGSRMRRAMDRRRMDRWVGTVELVEEPKMTSFPSRASELDQEERIGVMHKVFISYHHENDQRYKEDLVEFGERHSIFIDQSVDTGEILDDLSDQQIREIIRDEYLRDSTVTIVLVGTETRRRKHVDWEIYSSMYDGTVNKKSGILVITLPTLGDGKIHISHGEGEKDIYPDVTSWTSVNTEGGYERQYPYMPDRIIDNLLKPEARISIVPWNRIDATGNRANARRLKSLVDMTFEDRNRCEYDLSQPMRRANS